jgi:hypothetical protein
MSIDPPAFAFSEGFGGGMDMGMPFEYNNDSTFIYSADLG